MSRNDARVIAMPVFPVFKRNHVPFSIPSRVTNALWCNHGVNTFSRANTGPKISSLPIFLARALRRSLAPNRVVKENIYRFSETRCAHHDVSYPMFEVRNVYGVSYLSRSYFLKIMTFKLFIFPLTY